ncbi:MAG: sigma-70 family RNA polymerase sigma factor, partial [Nitrosopumilaceae archaeon]
MSNVEDIRLIEECKKGNSHAFGELVEKYQKQLYNAAFRIVNDRDTAKDVTQTVFIRAYEKLDTYNAKFKFFSWIYRMAVNEAINVLRQEKKNVTIDDLALESKDNPESRMQNS